MKKKIVRKSKNPSCLLEIIFFFINSIPFSLFYQSIFMISVYVHNVYHIYDSDMAKMIEPDDANKKATLLKAWGTTMAGKAQVTADAKITDLVAKNTEEQLVWNIMSKEVELSRNYWKTKLDKVGQKDGCELIKADQKDFTGKAWKGCE